MIKILIAPNSFKECAYSTYTAQLISDSFNKLLPSYGLKCENVLFPVSDGGDGFLEVIKAHFSTETRYVSIHSIGGEGITECAVEYRRESKTVFIESAKVIGLKSVPAEKRNPMLYNSSPLGELLKKINDSELDVDNVTIGIGGTATNDLGAGMLSHFGLKLLDVDKRELPLLPGNFVKASYSEIPCAQLKFHISIVVDVENRLLGEEGATKTFSRQKGACGEDILIMEEGFSNLLSLWNMEEEKRNSLSGSGGGIGAAFQMFFKAEVITANEFICNTLGLKSMNSDFNIVVTGEGAVDAQTLMNKGAMIIFNRYKDAEIPVVLICGENKLDKIPDSLEIIELKNYFKSRNESIKNFPEGIGMACRDIINKFFPNLTR